MKIARVRLVGFKSFVDPVDLHILPGLTGIVGPNGCGKSNLLEAIRWAMGEGSPKSLRGAGMEDVIFAGTATRPPRQFAEVSILAERDDDARRAEVEVTRRIERGAGSAWRIDGRDARARDAQLLFADAATGAHSPALVSQGRIGAVIAARPAERRAMLEEAAGIAGLHVRRREAEIRLKATENNLERIAESIADQDTRVAALRRQARSAERYRRLSNDIRVSEGALIWARWRDAAAAADAARAEAATAEALVADAAEAQRVAAALARDAGNKVAITRGAAQAARDTAADARHALATAESEARAIEARIAALATERIRLDADRDREGELAHDAGEALARLAQEARALSVTIADADQHRESALDAVERAEHVSRDAELAHARASAAAAERGAERRIAIAALDAARVSVERLELAHARGQAERDALPPQATADGRLAEARANVIAAAERTKGVVAAIDLAQQAHDRATDALADFQANRSTVAATAAALENEARSLAPTRRASGALAVVTPAVGFEAALAAALAEDLLAEVGRGSESGQRWTGATIEPTDPPLPCGTPLGDHVDAPPELARRLAQIAVVDEDSGTMLAVGQRIVTHAGIVRRWDGFVSQGSGAAEAERLVRRNRLTEIERALPAARAALSEADLALADARASLDGATAALREARQARDGAEAAHRDTLRAVDVASAQCDRTAAAHGHLDERVTALDGELSTARNELTTAQASHDALPADDRSSDVGQLAEAAAVRRDAVVAARAHLAGLEVRIGADTLRRDAALAEAAGWRTRSGKAAARAEEMAARAAALDREAETLADAPETAARAVRRLTAALAEATAAADAALADERTVEATLRTREAAATQAAEVLATAREARAGATARAENQELRRIEMGRVSSERFECPPPLLPERAGFDPISVGAVADASTRLDSLTLERERLGPVNLVAETELTEVEAERDRAAADIAELTEATHRLRGAIGSLNREGRVKLRAAFEAVDRHFRTLFTTLFDGGEAHLELIDSDDPLEAGLEIMAQPPGKRLASLTLLSGGEQALTAVALIFALFLTNPAPLCVLDEVDAPLDDANVDRFCDLLDRMTATTDTRYLIVTHNAVTMARMHRLYGVTMVEQGISRLVSVDLGSAALLAAE